MSWFTLKLIASRIGKVVKFPFWLIGIVIDAGHAGVNHAMQIITCIFSAFIYTLFIVGGASLVFTALGVAVSYVTIESMFVPVWVMVSIVVYLRMRGVRGV